jgi:dTDP-4-dehydrorhamnose reductase
VRPLLIIGRNGQVARELQRLRPDATAVGRDALDLVTGLEIAPLVERLQPAAVVNASAYTAVEKAEDETEAAFRLNRDAPAGMARVCAERGVAFVHFSTDYVFDGTKGAPYLETDPRNPLNVYGKSKAEGEDAIAAAGGRWAVLRTSWVYSASGSNFVKTMLALAASQPEVSVVADQFGRPTWAREAAQAALDAAAVLDAGREVGLTHATGGGEASWAEFARAIFAEAERRGAPAAAVKEVPTSAFPTRAARPLDSRLDLDRARTLIGWDPAPWRESLSLCLDELLARG